MSTIIYFRHLRGAASAAPAADLTPHIGLFMS